jgi:hypothetical protein
MDSTKDVPIQDIVAYLLTARTVEADKQPLLGKGLYTCSRGMSHVCCNIMYQ